jgi:hypothetical protein
LNLEEPDNSLTLVIVDASEIEPTAFLQPRTLGWGRKSERHAMRAFDDDDDIMMADRLKTRTLGHGLSQRAYKVSKWTNSASL